MSQSFYLSASPEAGKQFYQTFQDKGPIVMLNMLRFREIADYTGQSPIKPEEETSGKEAYKTYMRHVSPLLEKAGGKVLFYGKSRDFLIGPASETWDAILLVQYPSVTKFLAFAQDEAYLSIAGHRTAALADSRLLPMSPTQIHDW